MLKDEYVEAAAAAAAAATNPSWSSVEKPAVPMDMYHTQFDMSGGAVIAAPAVSEVALAHQYAAKAEDYRTSEEFNHSMYFGFGQEPSFHHYPHIVSGKLMII